MPRATVMTRNAAAWWGALGVGAYTLLPWSRGTGSGGQAATGLSLASQGWLPAGIGLALFLALAATLARAGRDAGRALILVAGGGAVLALATVIWGKEPFGAGALATTLSLVTLTGLGLARAGLVRSGGFVAAAVLWASLLVGLFVVYPLGAMLHASVVIRGEITASALVKTLTSPIFILLSHESLSLAAGARAVWGGAAGLLVAAAWGFARQWPARVIALRVVLLVAGGSVAGLLLGGRGPCATAYSSPPPSG